MQRPRLPILITAISAVMAVGPAFGAAVLAADTVVVVPGDTLTAISKRHDVGIARLVKLNDIADPNRIYAGQRLRISRSVGPSAEKPKADAGPVAGRTRTHVVQRGENLTWIARDHGVSVAAIVAANRIADPSRIFAGQRLAIPGEPRKDSPARHSAPVAMPSSMAALVARRDSVRRIIVEEADRYGVPEAFALAVAWQESGWQQGVVSHAGAVGVMQLLPTTADWVGGAMLGRPVRIGDARDNVRAGVRLLAHYFDRYDGNRDLVLAAYYQGQTAADRHGVYPVSRPYIASIRLLERLFGR